MQRYNWWTKACSNNPLQTLSRIDGCLLPRYLNVLTALHCTQSGESKGDLLPKTHQPPVSTMDMHRWPEPHPTPPLPRSDLTITHNPYSNLTSSHARLTICQRWRPRGLGWCSSWSYQPSRHRFRCRSVRVLRAMSCVQGAHKHIRTSTRSFKHCTGVRKCMLMRLAFCFRKRVMFYKGSWEEVIWSCASFCFCPNPAYSRTLDTSPAPSGRDDFLRYIDSFQSQTQTLLMDAAAPWFIVSRRRVNFAFLKLIAKS